MSYRNLPPHPRKGELALVIVVICRGMFEGDVRGAVTVCVRVHDEHCRKPLVGGMMLFIDGSRDGPDIALLKRFSMVDCCIITESRK